MPAAALPQVKEILVEESNVQPVNAPVTVGAEKARSRVACASERSSRGAQLPLATGLGLAALRTR